MLKTCVCACVLAFCITIPSVFADDMSSQCEFLLKYGIFDTNKTNVSLSTVRHLKQLFSQSNAGSIGEFASEAGSGAIGIPGLFDVSLGGNDAHNKFQAWKTTFVNMTDDDLIATYGKEYIEQKISPTLMAVVKDCIDHAAKKQVVAWIEPLTNKQLFALHLRFNPPTNGSKISMPVIGDVSFTVSSTNKPLELSDQAKKQIAPGSKLNEERIVGFRRDRLSDGILVVVNTDQGASAVEIPSEPDISQDIKMLQDNVKQLKSDVTKAKKTSLQTGNFLVGRNTEPAPAWKPMETPLPDGTHRQYVKFVAFTEQFQSPPKVMLSMIGFDAAHKSGGVDTNVNVFVDSVTTTGFMIRIDTGGDCHLAGVRLNYLAIPNN